MTHLSIIGIGPRGLYFLEELIRKIAKEGSIKSFTISVFEENQLGTGLAWNTQQSKTNLINISDRALTALAGREELNIQGCKISGFASYTEWCRKHKNLEVSSEKDLYPPRIIMGEYLLERAESLVFPLIQMNVLSLYCTSVSSVRYDNSKFILEDDNNIIYKSDILVLAIGHQSTYLSDEEYKNITFAEKNNLKYIYNPYLEKIAIDETENKKVIIKGLGLSMIDILRMLTLGGGGSFYPKGESVFLDYRDGDKTPITIYPYSLDGLPCAPKPIGSNVDKIYKPTDKNIELFKKNIERRIKQNDFELKHLLNEVAVQVKLILERNDFESYGQDITLLTSQFLSDKSPKSELFLDEKMPVSEYIKAFIEMAHGMRAPSLDYVIGQVWRHLQPTMYRLFAFSSIEPSTMHEIINVDEFTKRYSYGPPVESMLQMLALIEAGIVDMGFSSDPNINYKDDGWTLQCDGKSITATVFVNSILGAPVLEKMNSEIISSLKSNNLIHSIHKDFGVDVDENFGVKSQTEKLPLYVLGRNAKGSILGVDAILECFNADIASSAAHVANKIRALKL